MRARRLGLLLVLAALPLSGCEQLCSEGAVTWCPRGEGDELNDAPFVRAIEARLEAGTDPGAERLTAVFRAIAGDSDEDPIAYEWDLDGDGEFEKHGPLASHSYHRTATVKVTVRVSDYPRKLGAPGDARRTRVMAIANLAVNRAPRAEILNPSNLNVELKRPLYVGEASKFNSSEVPPADPDGDPVEFRWRLGDGRTVTDREPSVAYETPGPKQISLRATDPFGASGVDSTEQNVVRRPSAAYAFSPDSPRVGEEVTFDGSASSSPNGPIAVYIWDSPFGPDDLHACCGRTEKLTFPIPGEHEIELEVRDSQGGEARTTQTIFVRPAPGGNLPPSGRIAWTPQNPRVGDEVTFDATASRDPDGEIVSYHWDLDGNGLHQEGIGPTATWTFRTGGEHTVGLRIEDDDGAADFATRTVVVDGPPTASFTVTPPAPFVSQPVTLDASRSSDPEGPIAGYEWDLDADGFDDGTLPVFTTAFATPGERLVQLRVTDASGARDIATRVINVRPANAARARAAHTRRAAMPLPFSAQLDGAPLPGGQGELRRGGQRVSLLGAIGRGRLRARVVDPPGRSSRAERAVRRFLAVPWRTRLQFTRDRGSGRIVADAIALAARSRQSAACLRIRVVARPGTTATGRLRALGGTGAGARLHGDASFRFRIERDGTATAVGQLRARIGAKRPLPRACRRLAPR